MYIIIFTSFLMLWGSKTLLQFLPLLLLLECILILYLFIYFFVILYLNLTNPQSFLCIYEFSILGYFLDATYKWHHVFFCLSYFI